VREQSGVGGVLLRGVVLAGVGRGSREKGRAQAQVPQISLRIHNWKPKGPQRAVSRQSNFQRPTIQNQSAQIRQSGGINMKWADYG